MADGDDLVTITDGHERQENSAFNLLPAYASPNMVRREAKNKNRLAALSSPWSGVNQSQMEWTWAYDG